MATAPSSTPLHATNVITARWVLTFPCQGAFLWEVVCSTIPPVARSVDSQCRAFQSAIDVLGRPWNALILNVLQAGPLRFSELAVRAQGPGDKVLSARLKDLEARGLLVRQVDAGPPVRVAYELTRKGRAFRLLAEAIERWGRELVAGGESQRR
jgi:DNA-binding HxlR family transcriptional regulator